MTPVVVLTFCYGLVFALLYFERRRNPHVSAALWVPLIWSLISGSRPLGRWFEYGPVGMGASYEEGSPLDRIVLSLLILLSLWILSKRKIAWSRVIDENRWLIIVYGYLAASIIWSDLPYVSLKRWVKIAGFLPVAFVIATDVRPREALASVFRRVAYILIPFSLVLMKYYPHLGRQYNRWDGTQMWTGVAGHKNGLGMLCTMSAFFLIWDTGRNWKELWVKGTKVLVLSDLLVILISLYLLRGPSEGAFSATSMVVLVSSLMILMFLRRRHGLATWLVRHSRGIMISIPLLYIPIRNFFLPLVSSLTNRNETLTGRTDIWDMLLEIASKNPVLGVGYGAFWGLNSAISDAFGVIQAHNGYLGVYLELGLVGVAALLALFLSLCSKIKAEIDRNFDWGVFSLCFLFMILLYNYSEDTFFQTSYLWNNVIMVYTTLSCGWQSEG